jgi:cysteinyl-tRNA synthetase
VEDAIALARKLAAKDVAYEKLRSLYFDLSRVPAYGRLSGTDITKVKVGATIDLEAYEKLNPRDFSLFRRCRLSDLKRGAFVKTEWGNAKPSWHVLTAAMAMKHLGAGFDIHVSSRELMFPHHENENAMALALTGKPLARYWVHVDRVLGDPPSLGDLQSMGFSGRDIRYWLLSVHYRKPLTFSLSRLKDAQGSLRRLDRCVQALRQPPPEEAACPDLDQLLYDLRQGMLRAFEDDLNLPAALAALFRSVKRINSMIAKNSMDAQGAAKLIAAMQDLNGILSILNIGESTAVDAEILKLTETREQARAKGNWQIADRIREELIARGICVQDKKPNSSALSRK